MNLGHLVVRIYCLNSGILICRSTDISMYFRESLGVRDNESRLYVSFVQNQKTEFSDCTPATTLVDRHYVIVNAYFAIYRELRYRYILDIFEVFFWCSSSYIMV